MRELQTVIATMHRTDLSLAKEMNIRSDAILANQTDRDETVTEQGEFGQIRMISTSTRGVGLNRNIGILASDAEIILFGDDDITYYDGAAEAVKSAFRENLDADLIIFSMDYSRNGEIIEKRHLKDRRLHLWNAMKYGACALAVRREAILKNTVFFNQLFGGGCIFSAGEDSLFIRDCLKKGLHMYSGSAVLGVCRRDSSSWFCGCNEKYFYDKGVLLKFLFPRMSALMILRFAVFFKKETDIPVMKRIKLMAWGAKGARKLIPYDRALARRRNGDEE